MNAESAIKFLRSELNRRRMLSFTPLEVVLEPPTVAYLMDCGFTEEEADEHIAEWNPEVERADWQRRRDYCTALQFGIAALVAMNSLPNTSDIEFDYTPPGDPGEVVRDLFKTATETIPGE
jgi:hypothetical protein